MIQSRILKIRGVIITSIIIISVMLTPFKFVHASGHAILVGVYDYADSPLENPKNDVRSLALLLESLGWKTTIIVNPTSFKLKTGVRKFYDSIPKGSKTLFYFSGHGFQDNGENYLLPKGVLDSIKTLKNSSLSLTDINYYSRRQESARIIIVDACRSLISSGSRLSPSSGLNSQLAPPNTLIAYATSPGAYAYDGPKGANSPYVTALLSAFSSSEFISDAFRKTRIQTMNLTNGEQIPWESSSLLEEVALKTTNDEGGRVNITDSQLVENVEFSLNASLSQSREEIVTVDSAVDYLINLASNANSDSFLVTYPNYGVSELSNIDRSDVIASLNYEKNSKEASFYYYGLATAFQEGIYHPACRYDNNLDFDCIDFDRYFLFQPDMNVALRIAKYAYDKKLTASPLAKHYQHGWLVRRDILKAYDILMDGKSMGDFYYWTDANKLAQEILNELGMNINIDGDFGGSSCLSLKRVIGPTICRDVVTRQQMALLNDKLLN